MRIKMWLGVLVLACCWGSLDLGRETDLGMVWIVLLLFGGHWMIQRIWEQRELPESRGQIVWTDQIIIVTGGSCGLGLALSKAFLSLSATVIILDIQPVDLARLEVCSPGRMFFYPCNVGDKTQVHEVAKFIVENIGIPTVLINNAGVQYNSFLVHQTDHNIEHTFATNILAHFWMVRAFLPSMTRQKRGHIINISSCLGLSGVAKMTDYCSTKFAVVGFTESLRRELRLLNLDPWIKTTLVCPFLFKSSLFRDAQIKWKWITRPMEIESVVGCILEAIEKRNKDEIWLPKFVYVAPLIRMFPTTLCDYIYDMFGSNNAMVTKEEQSRVQDDSQSPEVVHEFWPSSR